MEGRKKKLETKRKKVEKRKVASNEEKNESWEQYKRRKLAECEETGRKMEKMVKGGQRNPRISRKEKKEKEKRVLSGGGRVQEWLERYGIDRNIPTEQEEVQPPREIGKQVGTEQKKEKVYVERGEYKFTFYKSVESVTEKRKGENRERRELMQGETVESHEVPPKSQPLSPMPPPQNTPQQAAGQPKSPHTHHQLTSQPTEMPQHIVKRTLAEIILQQTTLQKITTETPILSEENSDEIEGQQRESSPERGRTQVDGENSEIGKVEKRKLKLRDRLKVRLVKRAVEVLISKTVTEVDWRNEIEEEIGKDREKEKLKESGAHILRKRKYNRKEKYKQRKLDLQEKREEVKERVIKKARRRLEVKEALIREGEVKEVEKERKNTKKESKKKESGVKQRKGKIKETRTERKKLQERMRNWLRGDVEKIQTGSDLVKEVRIGKEKPERNSEKTRVQRKEKEKIKYKFIEVKV